MRKLIVSLLVVFASLLAIPASAQTPTITGTWTGTGTVNSPYGISSLTITMNVTSQTGSMFTGTVLIDTSYGADTVYGSIDSITSLWQLHACGYGAFSEITLKGYYTPAVPLVSPASITLYADYPFAYDPQDSSVHFLGPLVFTVTLTKS